MVKMARKMTRKDFMTLEGIGRENKGSIYRDYKGDTDGILYFEDKRNNLLIRQIVPIEKDVELVRATQKISAQQYILVDKDRTRFIPLEKVLTKESDEKLKERIRLTNPLVNDEGAMTVAIFNLKTAEFITIMDVESAKDSFAGEVGAITFTFSRNLLIRKRYGKKVRRWAEEFFKKTNIYPDGCREVIFENNRYKLIPIE